jgi:integrase
LAAAVTSVLLRYAAERRIRVGNLRAGNADLFTTEADACLFVVSLVFDAAPVVGGAAVTAGILKEWADVADSIGFPEITFHAFRHTKSHTSSTPVSTW